MTHLRRFSAPLTGLVGPLLALGLLIGCESSVSFDETPDVTSVQEDQSSCTPDCEDKECGDDGCGSLCGSASAVDTDGCPPAAPFCTEDFKCSVDCPAQCDGKECGDDGCGGECGVCDDHSICTSGGQCECQPQCDGKFCGSDGCGGDCGSCPTAVPHCTESGQCVEQPCDPSECEGKLCSDTNECGDHCAVVVCADGDEDTFEHCFDQWTGVEGHENGCFTAAEACAHAGRECGEVLAMEMVEGAGVSCGACEGDLVCSDEGQCGSAPCDPECGENEKCVDSQCAPIICKPGKKSCNNEKTHVQTCNADGTGYLEETEDCGAETVPHACADADSDSGEATCECQLKDACLGKNCAAKSGCLGPNDESILCHEVLCSGDEAEGCFVGDWLGDGETGCFSGDAACAAAGQDCGTLTTSGGATLGCWTDPILNECDDQNPCTVDACGDGTCSHTNVDDGTACGDAGDDGQPTAGDVCIAGTCEKVLDECLDDPSATYCGDDSIMGCEQFGTASAETEDCAATNPQNICEVQDGAPVCVCVPSCGEGKGCYHKSGCPDPDSPDQELNCAPSLCADGQVCIWDMAVAATDHNGCLSEEEACVSKGAQCGTIQSYDGTAAGGSLLPVDVDCAAQGFVCDDGNPCTTQVCQDGDNQCTAAEDVADGTSCSTDDGTGVSCLAGTCAGLEDVCDGKGIEPFCGEGDQQHLIFTCNEWGTFAYNNEDCVAAQGDSPFASNFVCRGEGATIGCGCDNACTEATDCWEGTGCPSADDTDADSVEGLCAETVCGDGQWCFDKTDATSSDMANGCADVATVCDALGAMDGETEPWQCDGVSDVHGEVISCGTCGDDEACVQSYCEEKVCSPDGYFCDGDLIIRCTDQGTPEIDEDGDMVAEKNCALEGPQDSCVVLEWDGDDLPSLATCDCIGDCSDGECGDDGCGGDCNGGQCPDGQYCPGGLAAPVDTMCEEQVCEPNSKGCTDNNEQFMCNAEGGGYLFFDPCPDDQQCQVGGDGFPHCEGGGNGNGTCDAHCQDGDPHPCAMQCGGETSEWGCDDLTGACISYYQGQCDPPCDQNGQECVGTGNGGHACMFTCSLDNGVNDCPDDQEYVCEIHEGEDKGACWPTNQGGCQAAPCFQDADCSSCGADYFCGPDGFCASDNQGGGCEQKQCNEDAHCEMWGCDGWVCGANFKCQNPDATGGNDQCTCENGCDCGDQQHYCHDGQCLKSCWANDGTQQCGQGDYCDPNGYCRPNGLAGPCNPGAPVCFQGTLLGQCHSTGMGLADPYEYEECVACFDGECIEDCDHECEVAADCGDCSPGTSWTCAEGYCRESCSTNNNQPCPGDMVCLSGGCFVCEPHQVGCQDPYHASHCSDDGMSWLGQFHCKDDALGIQGDCLGGQCFMPGTGDPMFLCDPGHGYCISDDAGHLSALKCNDEGSGPENESLEECDEGVSCVVSVEGEPYCDGGEEEGSSGDLWEELRAYYRHGGGQDELGNHNGSLVNAQWKNQTPGQVQPSQSGMYGSCLDFTDGVGATVTIDPPIPVSAEDGYTVTAWVYNYLGGTDNSSALVTGLNPTFQPLVAGKGWQWGGRVFVGTPSGDKGPAKDANGQDMIWHYEQYAGAWQHLAVIIEGETASYYRNGVYEGSLTHEHVYVNTHITRIGNVDPNQYPTTFGDRLDEVAIWARELSPDEIVDVYEHELAELLDNDEQPGEDSCDISCADVGTCKASCGGTSEDWACVYNQCTPTCDNSEDCPKDGHCSEDGFCLLCEPNTAGCVWEENKVGICNDVGTGWEVTATCIDGAGNEGECYVFEGDGFQGDVSEAHCTDGNTSLEVTCLSTQTSFECAGNNAVVECNSKNSGYVSDGYQACDPGQTCDPEGGEGGGAACVSPDSVSLAVGSVCESGLFGGVTCIPGGGYPMRVERLPDGCDPLNFAPEVNDPNSDCAGTQAMTLSAMVWLSATDPEKTIFAKASEDINDPPAYRLSVNNEGTVAFQVYDSQKSAGGIIHTTGYAFEVGQWVHVAVTWDGEAESLQTAYASGESTGFSIVINGVNEADLVGTSLQGASGISNFVRLRDTSRHLWLGLEPTANHISDVQLDKVLIFRNHMSTEAIKLLGHELCGSYLVNTVDNLLAEGVLDHGPYAAWEMGEFLTAEGEIRDEVGARSGAPYTQTKNFAFEAGVSCASDNQGGGFQPTTKEELQAAVDLWTSDKSEGLATYGEINEWDVSLITDMYTLFKNKSSFNDDISSWDVSNVTTMQDMFYSSGFNQDISGWDVSSLTTMRSMFYGSDFNQDISSWDVSNVHNMYSLFRANHAFNQDISGWDVSSVTNMYRAFNDAKSFNQDISGWDVSNVTNMYRMFKDATSFNQDISSWDVSEVKNMNGMFYSASSFNQDLSAWNVSSATDMDSMFLNANALSDENQCAIHTAFQTNQHWPYTSWDAACE